MISIMARKIILITGAKGFVGANLSLVLKEMTKYDVLFWSHTQDFDILTSCVQKADIIVHLAGVNRPIEEIEYVQANVNLTKFIVDCIAKTNPNKRLIFASSVQADNVSAYGASKRNAEKIIQENSVLNNWAIHRFPGVFGKFSRPYYNTVVATFCDSVINDVPLILNDAEKLITLMYIDDVVNELVKSLEGDECGFISLKNTVTLTVGELAEQISELHRLRQHNFLPSFPDKFSRNLYSTYVSFYGSSSVKQPLIAHRDSRGTFVEIWKTEQQGQFSYFTALPGVTRGEHYHNSKTEKFLVVAGRCCFKFRNLKTNEYFEIHASEENPILIDTIPGWVHSVQNMGQSVLVVLVWVNEVFDQRDPDTYKALI